MSATVPFPETDEPVPSSALGEAEISRLIKTAQAAHFVARDGVPKKIEKAFAPRTLVQIAFAAEKSREDKQNAAEADAQTDVTADPDMAVSSVAEEGPSALSDEAGSSAKVPKGNPEPILIDEIKAQHEAAMAALRTELAVQQQAAEQQAYDRGVTAGVEAAKSAEPTEEERALEERRLNEHEDIISRLEACVSAVAGPESIDDESLVGALERAVINLASERAGTVISENPDGFRQRIMSLVERVKLKTETVMVALNPEDLEAVMAYDTGPLNWKYIADSELLRGDIRISLDAIDIADVLVSEPQKGLPVEKMVSEGKTE